MAFVSIGINNYIEANKITGILNPDGSASRRLKESARERGLLYDATQGRKTRAFVIVESNQVFLSSIQAETIVERINHLSGEHR